jgi:hypothetical protein
VGASNPQEDAPVPSDAFARIRSDVAERLEVLRQEQERLRAALAALDGADSGSISAARPSAADGRRIRTSAAATPTPANAGAPTKARRPRSSTAATPKPVTASAPAASRRPPKRAARGANPKKVLTAVQEQPGLSASRYATAAGLKRTDMVYPLLSKLVESGDVQKQELDGKRAVYVPAAKS